MAIIKWSPFREPSILRAPFWEDFFEDIDMRSVAASAVDMYETDGEVVVKMPMPGIKPEEVDISVTGDTLTVRAEAKEEKRKQDKKRKYYMQELRRARYARSITLPSAINTAQATAEMDNGVLKITLPKTEEAKPRTVKVKAKN